MCGRFTLSAPAEQLAQQFDLPAEPITVPRYNIAPTQPVAVVRANPETKAREWALTLWGLIPSWAKDPSIGNSLINARAETLATNRTFRDPFQRRRCLIVADGFYEWRRIGSERYPMFFRLRSRRPFVFAGVWDRWKPREGEPLVSCAIVTCPPNGLVAPIHDRMPVIVAPEARAYWLAADAEPADLTALLRPYPESEMEAYPVSRLVNTPKNDTPECVQPADPPVDPPSD